jgi:hypothetical protein
MEIRQQTYAPRLAFIQLGNHNDRSLENETEFADIGANDSKRPT